MDSPRVRKKIDVTETQAYKEIYTERLRLCGFRYAKEMTDANIGNLGKDYEKARRNLLDKRRKSINDSNETRSSSNLSRRIRSSTSDLNLSASLNGFFNDDRPRERNAFRSFREAPHAHWTVTRRKSKSDEHLFQRPKGLNSSREIKVSDPLRVTTIGCLPLSKVSSIPSICDDDNPTLPIKGENNDDISLNKTICPSNISVDVRSRNSNLHLNGFSNEELSRGRNDAFRSFRHVPHTHKLLSREKSKSAEILFQRSNSVQERIAPDNDRTRNRRCWSYRDISSIPSIFEVDSSALFEGKRENSTDSDQHEQEEGYESITSSQESIKNYTASELRRVETRQRLSLRFSKLNSLDEEIIKATELLARIKRLSPTAEDDNKAFFSDQKQ